MRRRAAGVCDHEQLESVVRPAHLRRSGAGPFSIQNFSTAPPLVDHGRDPTVWPLHVPGRARCTRWRQGAVSISLCHADGLLVIAAATGELVLASAIIFAIGLI